MERRRHSIGTLPAAGGRHLHPTGRRFRGVGLGGFLGAAALVSPLAVIVAGSVSAEEWSQYRGPGRDGQATMMRLPTTWPDAPTQLWKISIGEGFASPVVADGRVFIMTRQGELEAAMALDLSDGRVLWRKTYPAPYTPHQAARRFGKGPRATPIVADGVVCFTGVDARMTCHAAGDGRELWQKDFSASSDIAETFCGASLTPLVEDGILYAHLGDDRGGRFFAADLHTGEELWSWDGQGPGYASPLMVDIGVDRLLVTFATTDLLAFDPKDGTLLWSRPYPDKWRENIPTPLVVGSRIVISDYVNGTLAVWPKKTDDGWVVEDLWHNAELTQRMASPVTDGERIFGFSNKNKGQLFAADPVTGKVLWQDEGRGGENAVLTLAGPWLLVSGTDGNLKVGRWEKGALSLVKTYEIAQSAVWAQPAWLEDGMLIKDTEHLIRYTWQAPPVRPQPEKTAAADPTR